MRHLRDCRFLLFGSAILVGCNDGDRGATGPDRDAGAMDLLAQPDQPAVADADSVRVVRASGDIAGAVSEFRTLLGTLNPTLPGEQPGGRREVNWDNVPLELTRNDFFPGDFFNVVSPRGLLLTTDGPAFHISDIGFIEVIPAYFL